MAFFRDKDGKISNLIYVVAGLFIVGLAILIVGIAMEGNCRGNVSNNAKATPAGMKLERLSQLCKYSQEADRIGLNAFLKKVQRAYFDNSPNEVAFDPDVKSGDMHEHLKKRYCFTSIFKYYYI